MTRSESLPELEHLLESFLQQVVSTKTDRLAVLSGINRLDDLARSVQRGDDRLEEVGGWFAEHANWLASPIVKEADKNRIQQILGEIKREIRVTDDSSPATAKISQEIDRWRTSEKKTAQPVPTKITLKRGPEGRTRPLDDADGDSIVRFANKLRAIANLFSELRPGRDHLLTILDDSLKKAQLQQNPEALLLSGVMLYYLKQHGYLVEPYVRRLKEAEKEILRGTDAHSG